MAVERAAFPYGKDWDYSFCYQMMTFKPAVDFFFSSRYEETRFDNVRDISDFDFKSLKEKDASYWALLPLREVAKIAYLGVATLFAAPVGLLFNLGATCFYLIKMLGTEEGEERAQIAEQVDKHVNGLLRDGLITLVTLGILAYSSFYIGATCLSVYGLVTLLPLAPLMLAMGEWALLLILVGAGCGVFFFSFALPINAKLVFDELFTRFPGVMGFITSDEAQLALKLRERFGFVNAEGGVLEIQNNDEAYAILREIGMKYQEELSEICKRALEENGGGQQNISYKRVLKWLREMEASPLNQQCIQEIESLVRIKHQLNLYR